MSVDEKLTEALMHAEQFRTALVGDDQIALDAAIANIKALLTEHDSAARGPILRFAIQGLNTATRGIGQSGGYEHVVQAHLCLEAVGDAWGIDVNLP